MNLGKTLQLIALITLVALAAVFGAGPIQQNLVLGLDLQGGTHVVLQADETERKTTSQDMQQVKAIMEERVNGLGVSEPIIQIQGTNRLIIELAGVKDPDQAVKLIGKTAVLTFRNEEGKVVVEGTDLKEAKAGINPQNNQPEVILSLTNDGAQKFGDVTKANVGKRIGIFLDEEMLQNPYVNEPIYGGNAQITGYTSLDEAHHIALLLNSGALPVKMNLVEKRTVGPTLGQDSLTKSQSATIIGVGLILIFMLAYYRLPGLVANFSLVLYSIIVLSIFVAMKAVLTLPGIAGFLLSIGMAVDANVIIYERLKEELRAGKTLRSAIDSGFKRAFTTILDSNLTTLIACVVLFYFGTGPIRGFAITLGIGILVSMFTAITFTRWTLKLVAASGLKHPALYGKS